MSVASRPRLGENPLTVKTTDILESTSLDATPLRRDIDAAPADADTAAGAAPRSVLVVDDSRFVRATLVRALSGRFPLQQADSGERAWELLLLDSTIGVVLSDLSMPGIDGFELLRRVRTSRLERLRDLPFAVLSGADDEAQRVRARELGADRFSLKGEAMEELAEWLRSRLDAREPARVDVADASPVHDAPPAPTPDPRSADGYPENRGQTPIESPIESPTESPTESIDPPVDTPSFDLPEPLTENQGLTPISPAAAPITQTPPVGPENQTANQGLTPIVPVVSPVASPCDGARSEDPRQVWYDAAVRPGNAGDATPALLRLHAPGLVDLPARLRRGIRAADALYVDGTDTAWLCVPATGPLAMRLALRFAMLAAGRAAGGGATPPRVSIDLHPVDPSQPHVALATLLAGADRALPEAGLAVQAHAGAWGPGWQCTLPWAAVRLLIA